jgi:glutathione S-transferase
MYARRNLHLEESLPMRNVSHDADAKAELERLGGKGQAPALVIGERVMYESADIAAYLRSRACWIWP